MVECSVIYDWLRQIGTAPSRAQNRLGQARNWSPAYASEALRQAQCESPCDPPHDIAALELELELALKWAGRLSGAFKMQESKDWLDDCHSFGRARAILSQKATASKMDKREINLRKPRQEGNKVTKPKTILEDIPWHV